MHINKYCFFFKKRLSNIYLLSDLVAVSCAAPGIFDRGGGGGGGPYPTFSKSSTYLTVVHQWFISVQLFLGGGGGGGGWERVV